MNKEYINHDMILSEYRDYCEFYCKQCLMISGGQLNKLNINIFENKLISLKEWYGLIYGKNLPDSLKDKADIKLFILNELVSTPYEKSTNC